MTIHPLGDAAVVLELEGAIDAAMAARIRALTEAVARHRPAGLTDIVPAFASVAVFFDAAHAAPFEELRAALGKAAADLRAEDGASASRVVEVPVVYGGRHGPDLAAVAAHTGLAEPDVVARHAEGDYLVHAIGFAPGFPYLGGLDPRLATPRRATPRALVPAGSVGIGGAQTGVYPFATPGGWNLIGRTPLALFDVRRTPSALLRAGDRVRFRAVREDEAAFAPEQGAAPIAAGPGVEVVSPGLFTTVQDGGRVGHRAEGVPLGGAADPFALRLANLVVGNDEGAAVIECTLTGPTLRFSRDTLLAWGGAETAALPAWRPIEVRAGETVAIGALRGGARGCLAIAGGFAVTPVLGGRGAYPRAGWGRALRAGDVLPMTLTSRRVTGKWCVDARILPAQASVPTVRVIAGAHAAEFEAWEGREFPVSAQSDRMGVRLGGTVSRRAAARELVSAPVAPGTIQVPPDGQPIVLLAEAQTIGGYPRLAHVITADLPLVAQLRPGGCVRFAPVSLDEARAALLARERALGLLREGLAGKFA